MTFRLNDQNVFDYLQRAGLWAEEDLLNGQVELKPAKNFNLLVSLANGKKVLVKQERHSPASEQASEFFNEWHIHQFWQTFPELMNVQGNVSSLLHFDADNAIAVFNYLGNYCDLREFYLKGNRYPEQIAIAIGTTLAAIHQATFQKAQYQTFLQSSSVTPSAQPQPSSGIKYPSPDIFGTLPADGLKFFVLYQRFESLGEAIAHTSRQLMPCCLTHNDLKLNNILLHAEQLSSPAHADTARLIRFIDWERANWGDPAFDLGTVVASYLQIWLDSLVVSQDMAIEESLKLAMTPLEQLQPSLQALIKAYFKQFPELLAQRPDFLTLTLQLTGLALIQQIQSVLQHQKTFGNNQICMLQVAKSLLCQPEAAIPTLFGTADLQLPLPYATAHA